ncbi:MAG: class I glutamine amidotransferase [Cenarchaeum symbiont of Oopsacas minuta]|nr:class I glutamine amidotransferase [Cenarchaeum symbiont of Oopsacas minuta]
MPRILVLQNSQAEGIGELGHMMENDGFELDIVDARKTIPVNMYDALIILGGSNSANDKKSYLLAEESAILKHADASKPVLGICLGAQLAAKALGSRVYRGAKKEVGFYDDLVAVSKDHLFSGLENFCAFHWHNDTFDLPNKAICLVKSNDYDNQAFRYKTIVGLQFHLEVDKNMIKKWLTESADYVNNLDHLNADDIMQQIDTRIMDVHSNLKKFYANFKSEFSI